MMDFLWSDKVIISVLALLILIGVFACSASIADRSITDIKRILLNVLKVTPLDAPKTQDLRKPFYIAGLSRIATLK
jgi:hypothetical protein